MAALGFGRYNPFPLRFGGGNAPIAIEHEALLEHLRPAYDISDDQEIAAETYAHATGLSLTWACNKRLANQGNPLKMIDQLAEWEQMCSLRPSENDYDITRRRVLAAKLRGYSRNALLDIEATARTLLGNQFVAMHVVDPLDEINFWPLDPGPPGYEWSSNRAHVQIEVRRGPLSDREFYRLMDQLDQQLSDMLPSWMTYNWHTGSGFIVGESILGEAAL